METIAIYRDLKEEFNKYCDENHQLSEVKAQRACWKFGVYPSTSQVFEIHMCHNETDCFHGLQFYEFCLLVATIKKEIKENKENNEFIRRPISNYKRKNKPNWDVFLGGACNPTTWRFDVAIPFLKEKNISFYNPQVAKWDASLVEIEEMAKQSAKVVFFVLDIRRTRGIASLVEAAFLAGQGRNLILVLPAEVPLKAHDVEISELDEIEYQSIHRSYLFIADLVQRQGIPIFTSLSEALKATRISLISNKMVQDLTEIDGVIPVKHSYVRICIVVKTLQTIFNSLDNESRKTINSEDMKLGLSSIFNYEIAALLSQSSKSSYSFGDFCEEYSIMLLNSLIHRHNTTSSSNNNYHYQHASINSQGNCPLTYSSSLSKSIDHPVTSPRCNSVHNLRHLSLVRSTPDISPRHSSVNLRSIDHSAFYHTNSHSLPAANQGDNISYSNGITSHKVPNSYSSKNKSWKRRLRQIFCCGCLCCVSKVFSIDSDNEVHQSDIEATHNNNTNTTPRIFVGPSHSQTISTLASIASHLFQPTLSDTKYDVFLGGTCSESDWRSKVAIPMLEAAGCSYYDPQLNSIKWSRRLLPTESEARANSKILIYVITSESTSTAALVEAAHFIGQKRPVVLHMQYLQTNENISPPLSPMAQLLQSSCSFPLYSQSLHPSNHKVTQSTDNHYGDEDFPSTNDVCSSSHNITQSTPGAPGLVNKLSTTLSASQSKQHLDSFSMSLNNLSLSINPLPLAAIKDHNRGRRYLLDVANRSRIPIFTSVTEAISHAIQLAQNPLYSWSNNFVNTHPLMNQ